MDVYRPEQLCSRFFVPYRREKGYCNMPVLANYSSLFSFLPCFVHCSYCAQSSYVSAPNPPTCLHSVLLLVCTQSSYLSALISTACLHTILLPVCTQPSYLSLNNPPTCLHSIIIPVCTQSSYLCLNNPPSCLHSIINS